MTNFETIDKKILKKLVVEYCGIKGGKVVLCKDILCAECEANENDRCNCRCVEKWLDAEYIKQPTITPHFKKLCEVLHESGYKYIRKMNGIVWALFEITGGEAAAIGHFASFDDVRFLGNKTWGITQLLRLEVKDELECKLKDEEV